MSDDEGLAKHYADPLGFVPRRGFFRARGFAALAVPVVFTRTIRAARRRHRAGARNVGNADPRASRVPRT